jgi:hypothetical protein
MMVCRKRSMPVGMGENELVSVPRPAMKTFRGDACASRGVIPLPRRHPSPDAQEQKKAMTMRRSGTPLLGDG